LTASYDKGTPPEALLVHESRPINAERPTSRSSSHRATSRIHIKYWERPILNSPHAGNRLCPASRSSESDREKVARLIDHGHKFDALMRGIVQGELRRPDAAMQRQFFDWARAAKGIAASHLKLLNQHEATERRKRWYFESLEEQPPGRPLTEEDRLSGSNESSRPS
jgi:hypothetical protein